MSKIGDAIGKVPMPGAKEPDTDDDMASTDEGEIAAMKVFSKASSPEEKASAFRSLLEAFGVC